MLRHSQFIHLRWLGLQSCLLVGQIKNFSNTEQTSNFVRHRHHLRVCMTLYDTLAEFKELYFVGCFWTKVELNTVVFKTGCIAVKRILPFFNLLDEKFGSIDWDTIQLRVWIRNKPLVYTLTLPQKQNTLGIVKSIFLSFQLISLYFKKVCSLRWRHFGLTNDVIEIDREQWNYLPPPGNGINFPPNHRSFFFCRRSLCVNPTCCHRGFGGTEEV